MFISLAPLWASAVYYQLCHFSPLLPWAFLTQHISFFIITHRLLYFSIVVTIPVTCSLWRPSTWMIDQRLLIVRGRRLDVQPRKWILNATWGFRLWRQSHLRDAMECGVNMESIFFIQSVLLEGKCVQFCYIKLSMSGAAVFFFSQWQMSSCECVNVRFHTAVCWKPERRWHGPREEVHENDCF